MDERAAKRQKLSKEELLSELGQCDMIFDKIVQYAANGVLEMPQTVKLELLNDIESASFREKNDPCYAAATTSTSTAGISGVETFDFHSEKYRSWYRKKEYKKMRGLFSVLGQIANYEDSSDTYYSSSSDSSDDSNAHLRITELKVLSCKELLTLLVYIVEAKCEPAVEAAEDICGKILEWIESNDDVHKGLVTLMDSVDQFFENLEARSFVKPVWEIVDLFDKMSIKLALALTFPAPEEATTKPKKRNSEEKNVVQDRQNIERKFEDKLVKWWVKLPTERYLYATPPRDRCAQDEFLVAQCIIDDCGAILSHDAITGGLAQMLEQSNSGNNERGGSKKQVLAKKKRRGGSSSVVLTRLAMGKFRLKEDPLAAMERSLGESPRLTSSRVKFLMDMDLLAEAQRLAEYAEPCCMPELAELMVRNEDWEAALQLCERMDAKNQIRLLESLPEIKGIPLSATLSFSLVIVDALAKSSIDVMSDFVYLVMKTICKKWKSQPLTPAELVPSLVQLSCKCLAVHLVEEGATSATELFGILQSLDGGGLMVVVSEEIVLAMVKKLPLGYKVLVLAENLIRSDLGKRSLRLALRLLVENSTLFDGDTALKVLQLAQKLGPQDVEVALRLIKPTSWCAMGVARYIDQNMDACYAVEALRHALRSSRLYDREGDAEFLFQLATKVKEPGLLEKVGELLAGCSSLNISRLSEMVNDERLLEPCMATLKVKLCLAVLHQKVMQTSFDRMHYNNPVPGLERTLRELAEWAFEAAIGEGDSEELLLRTVDDVCGMVHRVGDAVELMQVGRWLVDNNHIKAALKIGIRGVVLAQSDKVQQYSIMQWTLDGVIRKLDPDSMSEAAQSLVGGISNIPVCHALRQSFSKSGHFGAELECLKRILVLPDHPPDTVEQMLDCGRRLSVPVLVSTAAFLMSHLVDLDELARVAAIIQEHGTPKQKLTASIRLLHLQRDPERIQEAVTGASTVGEEGYSVLLDDLLELGDFKVLMVFAELLLDTKITQPPQLERAYRAMVAAARSKHGKSNIELSRLLDLGWQLGGEEKVEAWAMSACWKGDLIQVGAAAKFLVEKEKQSKALRILTEAIMANPKFSGEIMLKSAEEAVEMAVTLAQELGSEQLHETISSLHCAISQSSAYGLIALARACRRIGLAERAVSVAQDLAGYSYQDPDDIVWLCELSLEVGGSPLLAESINKIDNAFDVSMDVLNVMAEFLVKHKETGLTSRAVELALKAMDAMHVVERIFLQAIWIVDITFSYDGPLGPCFQDAVMHCLKCLVSQCGEKPHHIFNLVRLIYEFAPMKALDLAMMILKGEGFADSLRKGVLLNSSLCWLVETAGQHGSVREDWLTNIEKFLIRCSDADPALFLFAKELEQIDHIGNRDTIIRLGRDIRQEECAKWFLGLAEEAGDTEMGRNMALKVFELNPNVNTYRKMMDFHKSEGDQALLRSILLTLPVPGRVLVSILLQEDRFEDALEFSGDENWLKYPEELVWMIRRLFDAAEETKTKKKSKKEKVGKRKRRKKGPADEAVNTKKERIAALFLPRIEKLVWRSCHPDYTSVEIDRILNYLLPKFSKDISAPLLEIHKGLSPLRNMGQIRPVRGQYTLFIQHLDKVRDTYMKFDRMDQFREIYEPLKLSQRNRPLCIALLDEWEAKARSDEEASAQLFHVDQIQNMQF